MLVHVSDTMLVHVSDTIAESVWRGLRETTKDPRQESQRLGKSTFSKANV
jgi:hypothetical protein